MTSALAKGFSQYVLNTQKISFVAHVALRFTATLDPSIPHCLN